MKLAYTSTYTTYGLSQDAQARLSLLGDLILQADLNITAVRDPEELEKVHFLDSLSLLRVEALRTGHRLADIGSGGGLPALVLALALPRMHVTAIESQRKKSDYIDMTAKALGLRNLQVCCMRAEDHARADGRDSYDTAVSRAVASLPVVAEYSLPLLRMGGTMVAMKGLISEEERIRASRALDILGGGGLEAMRMEPFDGSRDRWIYVAAKIRETPRKYPRQSGCPAKRPLGCRWSDLQEGTEP